MSYQVYAALRHNNPRAKLSYAEYCLLSTQVRYFDWDHVKKQMYKVHLPHLRSGYVARIEYEAAKSHFPNRGTFAARRGSAVIR